MKPVNTIVEIARQGLATVPLDPVQGVQSLRPLPPLHVRRLGAPATYYYLVGWQSEKGIEVVVAVDMSAGGVIASVRMPQTPAVLGISAVQALSAAFTLMHKPVEGIIPELVWSPCRESASMFQPFYQVITEGGPVYVRIDGPVFTELTPFGNGG